jgi:ribosomal protein S18 acetylase RimI-like enzyme
MTNNKVKTTLSDANAKDFNQLQITLTKAFKNDPLTKWYLGTPDKNFGRRVDAFMKYNLWHSFARGFIRHDESNIATALWIPYGLQFPKFKFKFDLVANFRMLFAFGSKDISRIQNLEKYTVKQHHTVAQQFYHLVILGVNPVSQGQGLGKALLLEGIEKAHSQNLPVLLETSTEKNVAIYTHFGFSVYHEYAMPNTPGLTFYYLKNEPK